jgi:hypothetical protein
MTGHRTANKAFKSAALAPALLLCALAASAENFDAGSVGTSTAQFLKIASGARGAAMGEAFAALSDDAFALDWNPAGLINIKTNSMALMHSPYLADTYLDYFGYGENAGEVGSWGVSFKYMNFGKISRTDASGTELGSINPYDMAVNIGFACYISGFNLDPEDRFVLGATGKFVRSTIMSSDNTVSADLGLNLPYMFDNNFRVSLVAQNVMGTLRYDKEDAQLPLTLRLGTLTKLGDYFNATADVIGVRDNLPFFALGGEFRAPVSSDIDVALRAGANTRAISDLSGSRNFSFGAGIRYTRYNFDYSFSPFGELGSVNRFSATIIF